MNIQPPLKKDHGLGELLTVHSIFHTIQGEGPFVGVPSVFVRLYGCNLQCPGCDTEYTAVRKTLDLKNIIYQVDMAFRLHGTVKGLHSEKQHERPLIVLTGGEPFRQNIWPFIILAIAHGFRVQVETNGTLFLKPPLELAPRLRFLTIVCSPKAGAINSQLAPYITALKYVVKEGNVSEEDGLPILALDHPASPQVARPPARFSGTIYIQPMDEKYPEKNEDNLARAVWSAKHFGYTLCVQLHKIIDEE